MNTLTCEHELFRMKSEENIKDIKNSLFFLLIILEIWEKKIKMMI